ncbi:Retrovirus-related Pol polyprotein from transposon 297 [Araneus ventricosus]|uniref:RNA-directed DNA polymerase n=1 Tax=Araneus ventricosus TaxID=182803 RepID=A0A4Y2HSA8_ARAVE|nr:Retrovirus-related Pol polyprotein from transposon 297 [Araneus ventricosus]
MAAEQERLKMAAEQERLKMAEEQERLKMAAEQERLKMEIELEKLRMPSDGSTNPKHEKASCYELTKTVPSFDSKSGDITLFLSLFERQAKRAQIDTKDWVSGLLMLLPSDIVQLIARESDENFDNYNYIKSALLKRFKLSPEEFRKKFLHHQKNSEKSWREYTFEISNYFQEWIEELKIDSFEKLKNLIITDQIKRRAPFEAKDHFLDEWTRLVSPLELADKLDEYELVRSDRKYETKRKQQFNPIERYAESNQRTVRHKPFTGTWNARNMGYPSRNGESRQMHKFSCYSCGLEGHTARFCPSKAPQRGKLNPTAQGNVITTTEPKREDASTVLTAKINVPVEVAADVMELETVQVKLGSRTMTGIIDSGAQISVIREDFTSGIKYEGEGYIEISSAFGERETTPLRIFEMNIDDGVHGPVPVTCAVSKKLVSDLLLSTAAFEALKENIQMHKFESKFDCYDTVKEELEVPFTDIEASIELIATESDRNGSTQDSEETRTSFIESQMSDPTLSDAWEMARTEGNAYAIRDGVLTHTEYICGEKVRQVVLPKCKRDEVLRVAHEIPLAGHLGEQKTKQRIKYSFFWPEIKKDVKEFCQTCKPQSWNYHLLHVDSVFRKWREIGLTVNLEKCAFGQNQVKSLSHIVGSGQHSPDPEKAEVLRNLSRPSTKKDLRSFLGLASYYRDYIPNFSEIVLPLTDLTKRKISNILPWSIEAEEAFVKIKDELIRMPTLHTPDISRPFWLYTDASATAIGACLAQHDDVGKELPIAFFSKKLTPTQMKWSTIEREAFCVLEALKKFDTWIFGGKIQVVSDHNPLTYLTSSAPHGAKLSRWALALQRYNLTISYRRGIQHGNADALSRLAIDSIN